MRRFVVGMLLWAMPLAAQTTQTHRVDLHSDSETGTLLASFDTMMACVSAATARPAATYYCLGEVTRVIIIAPPPPPNSGVISVDFAGTLPAMGATDTAGVVPNAHWNAAVGVSRSTPLALVDEIGGPTPATVTWSANSVYTLPITDAAGNRHMMRGYLDTNNTSTTTVTVAGLLNASYDIYVYADGDNPTAATRKGTYRVAGQSAVVTDTGGVNFSTVFTLGSNYVKFSIVGTGFTLTATPGVSTDIYPRAPVNGIQIVPTGPAPVAFMPTANVPFHVVADHDGIATNTYQLFVDGIAVGTDVPVSALVNGSITLPVPGLTAGTHTLAVEAINAVYVTPSVGLTIMVNP